MKIQHQDVRERQSMMGCTVSRLQRESNTVESEGTSWNGPARGPGLKLPLPIVLINADRRFFSAGPSPASAPPATAMMVALVVGPKILRDLRLSPRSIAVAAVASPLPVDLQRLAIEQPLEMMTKLRRRPESRDEARP